MKIILDEDLSVIYKKTQALAKKIADEKFCQIHGILSDILQNNTDVQELTYSGAMTFINTIGTQLFGKIFLFSCHIGKKFSDADHCKRDLFEEIVQGMRCLLDLPEINKDQHIGDIKKIHVGDKNAARKINGANSKE